MEQEQIKKQYLNIEELRILKEIRQEQEKYFKPYLNVEDFI